jgi:hypothetical protein
MAEHRQPQNSPENAAAPAPNRRERRGGKSGVPAHRAGASGMPHRFAPVTLPRQYSSHRRSG